MLSISHSTAPDVCVLNVLPCHINHNGPAKITKRYWIPKSEIDGTRTVYFRGRRLRGRVVRLPESYKGAVLRDTKKTIVDPVAFVENDEEPELPQPIKIVEEVSKFEEVVVWSHDQIPTTEDNFVKNLDEWISLAGAIHAR